MPETAPISSPDITNDTGTPRESGTEPHIRALATPFKTPGKSLMIEQDGGLLIKDVKMLASGTWTDSAVGTPLTYPEDTLRQFASNWIDNTGWSRHLGGVPRDITDKVGEIRDPRYLDGAVTGDIFIHGATQKSRDTMELVKRKLISYVSVEHGGDERYNPATRQMEASSISFLGFAFVNKGACKLCRINEATEQPEDSSGDTMENKELEAKVAELTKELEAIKAKPKEEPKVEIKTEIPKELSDKMEAMAARIIELEKQPVAPVTSTTPERELGEVETYAVIDKVNKTVRGV